MNTLAWMLGFGVTLLAGIKAGILGIMFCRLYTSLPVHRRMTVLPASSIVQVYVSWHAIVAHLYYVHAPARRERGCV